MSPNLGEAAADLVTGLRQSGASADDMAAMLRGVVAARPRDAVARAALASLDWDSGARDAAIDQYRLLAAEQPGDGERAVRLGVALLQRGCIEEGCAVLAELVAAQPGHRVAQTWLALGLVQARRPDEAEAVLRAALRLAPNDAGLHFALGETLLLLGRMDEGWVEYAWRWQAFSGFSVHVPTAPLVRPRPEDWAGKSVLVFAEQGNGDTLQCLRYVQQVVATGARVRLDIQPGLVRLARGLPGVLAVENLGSGAPECDFKVPMMHLPWAFGAELTAAVPYLAAEPGAVAAWRGRLAGLGGLKVGLVWAGAPRPDQPDAQRVDARRSLQLAQLAPLANVPGVSLVSLQKGDPASQARQPPADMVLHDWSDELADFADTAALMTALDLVITVDTAAAHLAGALGRPTWLLNRHDACWRWLLHRTDSPWYPTLRQFRQRVPGDWGDVVRRVAAALGQLAEPGM